MASFLRHIGKHGDRKLAIVFREVPGEPHMALVVYTETLNRTIHDPLIRCIESDIGQNSNDLADALNRSYTTDGQIILQKLHAEGMLKKVNTEVIVMTPSPNTRIKLSELNKILDEMQKGEDAVKKLAEMDASLGIQDVAAVARKMRGNRDATEPSTIPANKGIKATGGDVLGDDSIANNLRQQALRMSTEANGLLAEAARLTKEAESLTSSTISGASIDVPPTKVKKTKGKVKKVALV
jgi:hypothetical protein